MPARRRPVGHVALVGAGPGDPGLLTVRGQQLLSNAHVVLYDRLVDSRLLEIPTYFHCERIYVGKDLPGHASRDVQQRRINELMVKHAKNGKRVVRLKGGDPYIFGRGGEEGLYLAKHGVSFEVVPGVTAALGAAATTGIPFTHRGIAQEVTFATAHEAEGASAPPWETLGKLPGTLVFYMGTFTLAHAAAQLIDCGRRPTTPVAVVERATTPRQRTVVGTLATIAQKCVEAQVRPPSLVIVGDVVRLRPTLNWFESRPIFGRRILSLRPGLGREDTVTKRLELDGAEVVRMPGLEFLPPKSWSAFDKAMLTPGSFDWLILTSPTAVRYFEHRFYEELGLDARYFKASIAVIGAETKRALEGGPTGLKANQHPQLATSEGLAANLASLVKKGQRFLLPRADKARDVLPKLLRKAGHHVQDIVLYRTVAPKPDPAIVSELAAARFDAVLVTSAEIARNLKRWLGRRPWPNRTKLVTIGPVTSAAVREIGWPVSREAKEPGKLVETTIEALTK